MYIYPPVKNKENNMYRKYNKNITKKSTLSKYK